jgi:hypothetical protein
MLFKFFLNAKLIIFYVVVFILFFSKFLFTLNATWVIQFLCPGIKYRLEPWHLG